MCIDFWNKLTRDNTRKCKKNCKDLQKSGEVQLDPVCGNKCCNRLCKMKKPFNACKHKKVGYCKKTPKPTKPPVLECPDKLKCLPCLDSRSYETDDCPFTFDECGPTALCGYPGDGFGHNKCADEIREECVVCPADVKQCYDCTFVSRDPTNDCQFEDCPPIICTADAKECPDGSFVSRDPNNGCQFEDCPPVACTKDLNPEPCPDGSLVGRDPFNNCEWLPCPPDIFCTADVELCWDGVTFVGRDPYNGCAFKPCPPCPECAENCNPCTKDLKFCPYTQTTVGRDPNNNCEFPDCPCPKDLKVCPFGPSVGRLPDTCEFPPCACPKDLHVCPDGSTVGRVPDDCEFVPCPSTKWCPAEKPENGAPCTGKYGYAIGQNCNYNYVDLSCEEGVEECRPTEFYTCRENGWNLAIPRPFCSDGDYPSGWYESCDPCPEKPPKNGSPCSDDYNLGQTCDYNFLNVSCEEGKENCQPTEHYTCDASGWLLAMAGFYCEGDNYPDDFLASCEPQPSDDFVICTNDVYMCPNGEYVPRSGPECEFDCGPCTEEARKCKDGSSVSRIPPLCEFEECP